MANHCYDVICANCGNGWCTRCAVWSVPERKPNPETVKKIQEVLKEIKNRYPGYGAPATVNDAACSSCASKNVYTDDILNQLNWLENYGEQYKKNTQ